MATEIKSTSIKSQNIIAEPQVNKPGSPEAGQIIQATGTGDIAKGIYHYSGAAWMSLDNAQGDLETLRLIMSTDTTAVGFSSALNSTSTLAGNTNAVPHETSTGTGMLGALEIPSTGGDALLTEFDANKVFRYYSAGANNNNDYFGIPVDIPAQTRGQNIVIKFKYRTEEASDTTSNGDFQVSVWDKSNGVSTTQASTLTTGTTISAGSNILMTAKTNLAVGDKIWFETGTAAVNNVANSITQAYITSISSTDNNITVSEDVTVVASGIAVTGWLSDKTSGLLTSADSDTNKVGKDFSIAVKTEEDTEQIVVWFSNKSTTTNVIELFFDGILVSQNKFLQASSQTKNESYSAFYQASFWDASTSTYEFNPNLLVPKGGSPPLAQSNFLDIADITGPGTTGTVTAVKAKQDITLHTNVGVAASSTGDIRILDSNGDRHVISGHTGVAGLIEADLSINLAKDDYIYFYAVQPSATNGFLTVTAEPQTSDVILLESQDEIFTDWVSDGTFYSHITTSAGTTTQGATTTDKYWWRRDGSDMIIRFEYQQSTAGTASTGVYRISLPSGYSADLSKITPYTAEDTTGNQYLQAGTGYCGSVFAGDDSIGYMSLGHGILYDATKVRIALFNHGGPASQWWNSTGPYDFGDADFGFQGELRIPIQGWNSNFNPLMSLPLVDLGQPVETWFVSMTSTSNFWDGTGVQRQWNEALLVGPNTSSTAAGNISTSNLISIEDKTSGTNTVTAIVAKQDITLTAVISNFLNSTAELLWLNQNDQTLAKEQTHNADNYIEICTVEVFLRAGEYIWSQTDAHTRGGGITITAKKAQSGNLAHIIKPAVAVITEESAGYGAWGGDLGAVNTWQTRALNTIRGESWFVTLNDSTDTFTLEAGTYKVIGQSPLYAGNAHKARLYNSSDSVAVVNGQNSYSNASYNGQAGGFFMGTFTITSSKDFKVQHIFNNDNGGISQGGFDSGGTNSGPSMFTTVMIEKLK